MRTAVAGHFAADIAAVLGCAVLTGGGAILKKDGMIEGTSTAAAIWSAGCVGVAVAMGRLEIAVLISVFMVGIFYFVSPLKQKLSKDNDDV